MPAGVKPTASLKRSEARGPVANAVAAGTVQVRPSAEATVPTAATRVPDGRRLVRTVVARPRVAARPSPACTRTRGLSVLPTALETRTEYSPESGSDAATMTNWGESAPWMRASSARGLPSRIH